MRLTSIKSIIAFLILLMRIDAFPIEKTEMMTINSFLVTAENDYSLKNHQELLDYLETATSSTPYIDKIEFRSNSEDFEIAKQRYALRFYPKGWGETRYNNRLTESIYNAFTLEHEVYYNKALRKRYRLIIDYLESMNLIRVMQELQAVYEDRISVLKKQVGTLSFDVSEYITAETEYTELQLDLVKIENKLTGIVHKIHLTADCEAEISFNEMKLIRVEEIVCEIDSLEFNPDSDNIYLRDRINKIEIARIKYNIDKAQERDYLSYFELEYDRDNYQEPERAYSIDFGFRLPFINSDREDINRRKVNYIEEKLKYEDEKRATSERIKSTLRSLNRFINQYKLITDRKANDDARSPLETYMQMEGINPLNLLEIRESIINNDLQQDKIYYSILYDYVELMDLMGKLSEKPLRNYISKGMEIINEQ